LSAIYYLTFPYLIVLGSHPLDEVFRALISPFTALVLFGIAPIWAPSWLGRGTK